MDGQFDKLEELIYVESHLSNTSAKFYGEITQQMLKNSQFPGSTNGTGLFQTIVGLKIREVGAICCSCPDLAAPVTLVSGSRARAAWSLSFTHPPPSNLMHMCSCMTDLSEKTWPLGLTGPGGGHWVLHARL